MKEDPAKSAAREINRLHQEVAQRSRQSKAELNAALVAAWRCGRLLVTEKMRVRRTMGPGAWMLWLEQNFQGHVRTSARYIALAASVSDEAQLKGMSLRQAYHRLGIATEPKCRQNTVTVQPLPEHIRLTTRLLAALQLETGGLGNLSPPQAAIYRDDLRKLYGELRRLFEPERETSGQLLSKSA